MVEHYRSPLTAYAAACALPKDGEQWLVIASRWNHWTYLYPACAERGLELLIASAKANPAFDCFKRYMPSKTRRPLTEGVPCALCGQQFQRHP